MPLVSEFLGPNVNYCFARVSVAHDMSGLKRIPIMLQYILHERRIWRHFGGQPSHELTDAAAKRIPETESPAKTPPFLTPWKSRFNPNGNRFNCNEIPDKPTVLIDAMLSS